MGSVSSSNPSSNKLNKKSKREGFLSKRRATHSGSWYTSDPKELNYILENYITDAKQSMDKNSSSSFSNSYTVDSKELQNGIPSISSSSTRKNKEFNKPLESDEAIPKAIVAPHAGYNYSGETSGYAYAALREAFLQKKVDQIIVLFPSHQYRLDGCAISEVDYLCTPLGDLTVDTITREILLKTGYFGTMDRKVDEREHSGEMQYPFIYQALSTANNNSQHFSGESHPSPQEIPITPIMVGSLSPSQAEKCGQILAPILAKPNVFTIITTDFCHWGSRFQYSPYDSTKAKHIFQYIQWLDNIGMDQICTQDPKAFSKYLTQTRNTICGRYPITLWLNSVKANRDNGVQKLDVEFLRYAQSSHIRYENESSVSYASGVARLSS